MGKLDRMLVARLADSRSSLAGQTSTISFSSTPSTENAGARTAPSPCQKAQGSQSTASNKVIATGGVTFSERTARRNDQAEVFKRGRPTIVTSVARMTSGHSHGTSHTRRTMLWTQFATIVTMSSAGPWILRTRTNGTRIRPTRITLLAFVGRPPATVPTMASSGTGVSSRTLAHSSGVAHHATM